LVGFGVGVAVWLGFCDGFGVRVLPRLGAVLDRVGVGVGLFVFDRVGVGVGVVRRGVYDGVVGRIGVAGVVSGASSIAEVTDVTGVSWLVTLRSPVSRRTNHPMPASRTKADSEAMRGPATPLPSDRLWFVMVSSLAQISACRLPGRSALHEPLTISSV
jgi:hypothetical protein